MRDLLLRCAPGGFLVIALSGLCQQPARAQSPSDTPSLGSARLAGDDASRLDFGVGAFDILGDRGARPSAEGQVEFRYGRKLFFIGPAIGILANTRGGIFGYGGLYADVRLGQFVLTPVGAVGGYHRGGSEDLGGVFQFRASLELSYEFANQSRLGVQLAHISNAGTHTENPGPNEVLLTYTIPLPLP